MPPSKNSPSDAARRPPEAAHRLAHGWFGGATLALAFVPGFAGAGGLQAELTWPLAAEYITNPRFEPDGTAIVRRVRSAPVGELAWNGEVDRVYGRAGALLERTDSQSLLQDRTAPRGAAGWDRRLERGSFGAEVKYEEMAMRIGESEENGIAGTDGTRKTKSGRASLEQRLAENTSLNVEAGAQNVRYARLSLPGFDLYSTSAKVTMGISPLMNATLRASTERRLPELQGSRQIEIYSARAGIERQAGERLTWVMDAGAYRQAPLGKTGWLAHAAIDYRLASGSAGLTYDRNATANTGLGVAVTERISGTVGFNLTELDSFSAKLGRREARTATLEKVTDASLSYRRRVSQKLEVGASYQWLRHTSAAGDADGQTIGLNLNYSDSSHW